MIDVNAFSASNAKGRVHEIALATLAPFDEEVAHALEEVRDDYLPIHTRDVLAQLRAGDEGWADMVPAEAATLIRQRGLLGHGASA